MDEGFTLTHDEALIVRKVLQVANLMYTVIDKEFHDNKIDDLVNRLREYENAGTTEKSPT